MQEPALRSSLQSFKVECSVLARTKDRLHAARGLRTRQSSVLADHEGQSFGPKLVAKPWSLKAQHAVTNKSILKTRRRAVFGSQFWPTVAHPPTPSFASVGLQVACPSAHSLAGLEQAVPNTSLKLSANGRPPGPGHSAVRSILWPGPGALPLSPA